ncbi:MAG: permease [Desulfosudis oleivorans]|nr:permease [Desulfosudis oleivorans]
MTTLNVAAAHRVSDAWVEVGQAPGRTVIKVRARPPQAAEDMDTFLHLMNGGAGNLAAYLAAHVLLCLLPAFFIAGAMAALIPKASITRWLGRNAAYRVSYPAAAAAGSLLAVCSCTIVPLFAGIYKKGAGLGPAITFLFFAPAGNILALAYTGSILGAEFALRALRAVPAVRHRHRHADGGAVLARRCQPRCADRHLVRRAGEHRPGRHRRAAVAGGGADRRHAEAVAADGHRRCGHPAAALGRSLAGHAVPVGALRRRQGRGRRERAGFAADRAAAADRRHRLEGPGEHRRGRQPLDLGRARPDGRDAARGGAAADAARATAWRSRSPAARVAVGPGDVGRAGTTRGGSMPTPGAAGCGKPGASSSRSSCCWWWASSSSAWCGS